MTIIYFFCFFPESDSCIQTISRKNNDIILIQKRCLMKKSILQYFMPDSLCKNRLSETDHLSCKSEFPRIKTSSWKESRNQVCIDWFCHKSDKSFTAATIEKCIMENGNFEFLFFHGKRILKKEEKTIEFGKWIRKINASLLSLTGLSTSDEQNSSYHTFSNSSLMQTSIRACVLWNTRCSSDEKYIQAGFRKYHFLIKNINLRGYFARGRFAALISLDMISFSVRPARSQNRFLLESGGKKVQKHPSSSIVIHRRDIIGVMRRNMKIWWNSDF